MSRSTMTLAWSLEIVFRNSHSFGNINKGFLMVPFYKLANRSLGEVLGSVFDKSWEEQKFLSVLSNTGMTHVVLTPHDCPRDSSSHCSLSSHHSLRCRATPVLPWSPGMTLWSADQGHVEKAERSVSDRSVG